MDNVRLAILRYSFKEKNILMELYSPNGGYIRGYNDTWEEAQKNLNDYNYGFLFEGGQGEGHFEVWAIGIEENERHEQI